MEYVTVPVPVQSLSCFVSSCTVVDYMKVVTVVGLEVVFSLLTSLSIVCVAGLD